MKYIRGQDGKVYSVSQLIPPSKGQPQGRVEWRLKGITADGYGFLYATYGDMKTALKVYEYVWRFMGTQYPLLSFAELGREGKPYVLYVSALEEFGAIPLVFVPNEPSGTDDAQEEPDDTA